MEHEDKLDDRIIGRRSLKFENLLYKDFIDKHFILKFDGANIGTLRMRATTKTYQDVHKRKLMMEIKQKEGCCKHDEKNEESGQQGISAPENEDYKEKHANEHQHSSSISIENLYSESFEKEEDIEFSGSEESLDDMVILGLK